MSDVAPREPARVVLYVRQGCHLCEAARDVVGPLAADAGTAVLEVDIDAGADAPDLVDRYGELVPVVTVDGVQQGYWRIDAGRVRRALAGGPA
ncbi:glutaredoxin family protein [Actinotalea solisilvae]|uniref:glutaredoxin family protein n=1 Tax=Actinotalea solisilvae TaxID=2072922 RepID=UPI0018F173BD|nr:glutaredoxin family protein [Actinotalea solisilvae]